MAETKRPDIKVGDWVRFYQNGRLVIGIVGYIRPRESWERSDEIATDIGCTHAEYVKEARRG